MNKIKSCIANAPLVGTSVIFPPLLIILKTHWGNPDPQWIASYCFCVRHGWIIDLSLTQSLKEAGGGPVSAIVTFIFCSKETPKKLDIFMSHSAREEGFWLRDISVPRPPPHPLSHNPSTVPGNVCSVLFETVSRDECCVCLTLWRLGRFWLSQVCLCLRFRSCQTALCSYCCLLITALLLCCWCLSGFMSVTTQEGNFYLESGGHVEEGFSAVSG